MKFRFTFLITLLSVFAFTGCHPDPIVPIADEDVMQGGETTVEGDYISIFEQPASNLTSEQIEQHRLSDLAFGDIFVTAPATINAGLGPLFNQNSCESCHVSNGRSPFPESDDNLRGLLLRISIPGENEHGGPLAVPGFGGQLQTKSTYGKAKEASLSWTEIVEIENYIDGNQVSLRHFDFQITSPYIDIPGELLVSPRMAPPVFGLGLLEAIPETDIMALADPDDANGDGISGKANIVWDEINQQNALGRFGWKASSPSLLQQSAAAYRNDMGITNPIFNVESCDGQLQCDSLQDDPEIDMITLATAAFYPTSLAVPSRRNWNDPEVIKGKNLFTELSCASCHHPKFITGQQAENNFLKGQAIFPHTDMLLHDMGEGLADHRTDFKADGREWRTPALWGIGLTYTVGGHENFLHDGRARNLEEAIMWHGGEAQKSKNDFKALSVADRNAVIKYLESL